MIRNYLIDFASVLALGGTLAFGIFAAASVAARM